MTNSDSDDFARYIYKRCTFFQNTHFEEFSERTLVASYEGIGFYCQRVVEEPGLETPLIKF